METNRLLKILAYATLGIAPLVCTQTYAQNTCPRAARQYRCQRAQCGTEQSNNIIIENTDGLIIFYPRIKP